MRIIKPAYLSSAFLIFASAMIINSVAAAGTSDAEFGAYWYAGKAEITSYNLEQARYGEERNGRAVLIFVTEDFSQIKHVKLDNPSAAGSDRVKVLKMNFVKKFLTGIYPYSMMTSVFTPVNRKSDPRTLKITTSSQEWCGHTFVQLGWNGDEYKARQYSYFESQGDKTISLGSSTPEDEIWNIIRIDPSMLPTGVVSMIPGTMFQRLRHVDWSAREALAALEPDADNGSLMSYTIAYDDPERDLIIRFKKEFPHEIESWEESYVSGWGSGAQSMTTRAMRIKRVLIDYWTKNHNGDEVIRKKLGLD